MKRLAAHYLRDQSGFMAAYFIGSFLVIFFYFMLTRGKIEVLYPILLVLFVYLVFFGIRWFRYYRFNTRLANAAQNEEYDLAPSSCEQQAVQQTIAAIHHRYLERISEIQGKNRDKNRFISQWVHNMKTPVSVIDLILQRSAAEPEDFDSLREENAKLLASLEQILVLLRLDEFSKDYTPEVTELGAAVRKVINGRKNQFIYSGVFPRFETTDRFCVLTDPKWNELMLDQFVSNAIKYSADPACARNVNFELRRAGDEIILTIRDEGVGIPESDLGRIFEPFFTGENGRMFKSSSGIGLYLCAEIARRLGHRIEVDSQRNRGTAIRIAYLSKL